jgi:hypothetical protein
MEIMSDDKLARSWAHFQLLTPIIEGKNKEKGGYLKHIHTENTARDMLFITQKLGWEKLKYIGYS